MLAEITFSEFWAQMAEYDSALWYGVFAAIVTFVIELVLGAKGIIFAGDDKKLAKAKKEGNVLIGKRKKCWYENRAPQGKTVNRKYIAIYEYTLDGKIGTKQVVLYGREPGYTINLYYTSNSKKVFSEYDLGKNPLKVLIYIIPVIVAYIVMKLFGYNF